MTTSTSDLPGVPERPPLVRPAEARVLIVDDDPDLRLSLAMLLREAGLDVETHGSGRAGLAGFEARGADLVVTELELPDLDGLVVLREMRLRDPDLPVILMAARGSGRALAMHAGAYDHITKPFDPGLALFGVRRALEARALRRQNARLRQEAEAAELTPPANAQRFRASSRQTATGDAPAPRDPGPAHPLRARVEAFERGLIAEQFAAAGRNQSETARRLGVSRPTLIQKLRKYGLS
jgi:DNA-binding NtrC family response regulator